MGKTDRRPWRDNKDVHAESWQRPPSSGKWDYWPGSWKASPKARARFPSYDRDWHDQQITVIKEERVPGTATDEESVAKPVQQAVNALRKAEARMARICREQKEKATRWAAYQREVKAAFVEEEKRHGQAQERLAGELHEAQQQQAVAKQALAQTMEAIFGSAMEVSKDSSGPPPPTSETWDRMFGTTGTTSPQAALDPDLMELLRMYKNGQLPGFTGRLDTARAETSGPTQAQAGWPTGADMPQDPVPPAYRAPSHPRPAPYLPSSPSLQTVAMDNTGGVHLGRPGPGSGNTVRPPPPTPTAPVGGPTNPGPPEPPQAPLGTAAYDGGEASRQERQSCLSPHRHASGQTTGSTTCYGTLRGSAESRADSGFAPPGSGPCFVNNTDEAWLCGGRRRGVGPGSSRHRLTWSRQIGVSNLGEARQGPFSQFRLFCWDDALEGPCGWTVSGVKLSHLALPFGSCPLRGIGGCAELWSLLPHPGFCTGFLFFSERVCQSSYGLPFLPQHQGCLIRHPCSLLGVFPVSTPWVLVFRYRISHSSSRREPVDMECRLGCLPVPCTVPFDLHDVPLLQPDRVPNNYIGGSGVVTCPGFPAFPPTLLSSSFSVEAIVALGSSLSATLFQWLAQASASLLPTLRFIVLLLLLRLLFRSAPISRQRSGSSRGAGLDCLPLGIILAFSCFSVSQVQVLRPHTAFSRGSKSFGKRPRCRRDSYLASRPWCPGLSKVWFFILGFQTLPVLVGAVPAELPLLVRHATGLVALLPDRMPSSDRAEEPASPPPASRWVYTRVAEAADTPPGVIAMPKHCILFQAGHSVRHFLAHLRAPFTRSAIMQEALDYYPELRDHWVLLETVPQVAEGAASLIAVPSWTQAADRAIFLLDFSAYNGPVFAWFDWSYVNRTSLASIARVYAQTPWEVFYGNRDVPLGPEEAVTASPGHVFRFQPKGTMQLSRPLLSNMLQDMSLWQDAPPAVPRERLACDWCVMMSHVTRVIPHIGYSRSEIQAQAAVALDSDLNDLIFGYPKPHSPLNDLVFRGTLMRGVFAAVPRSASGARVGIFAFVDPRAIGLNPTFLHVAEGDLHISHVLGILGFRVPTGFQLQVSGVPFSEQIAQVSDECTLELSVVPVARAIPAPLQLSASPGPGQRDLASAGAERNGAHGAHAATRIWPRAFRRDDPPPPDPEAHLNLATGDSDEEELAVDGEAFIDASFLIFAPRFQPELVRLVLQAPCDVDTALRALSDTQNSAFDLSFDCLLPAVPQPDTAFGSVLAVPPWDRRGSHVLVDSRQVDGRLFALSFHGRLSRAAFLVKAGFKQMHGLEVYLHGRVLDHRDWYQFLAGDTVFVRQTAVPLPPPVALADMLRDRHDWHYPCPSFEGPHLVAFLLLTDEGSRVVAIDPDEVSTTAAFRAEVERILGYDRRNTAVCPIQPRLVDLSVLGQRCKSVVAVTQIVLNPPPSTLQASPPLHVVFLDARLLLKDISWVVAAEGLIEIPAVLECFQQDAPFGFSVEATGVPTEILDGSDYFRAPHGSCVRLTYVQDSSAVGSSDGNTDGGLVLDQDETTGSSSDGEPSASSSEAEPRPGDAQLEPCQRERSRSRTRPGANRSTKTGIWMAGLAAVHAASAVPASSTATLSPTASVLLDRAAVEQADFCLWCAIVSFGLLLLVGLLLSAALRRHRLLQEPRGDTASSQAHLDTLRSFVPILGGPWHPRLPYDLGHLVEPDIDDQEAQAAGIREEVRTVQCLILTYDFTPNVHSVDLPLPTTTEDLVQALQPCRSSTHQVHLPSLLPVLPQPQSGMATFVTAPHWHAWGHGVMESVSIRHS